MLLLPHEEATAGTVGPEFVPEIDA